MAHYRGCSKSRGNKMEYKYEKVARFGVRRKVCGR
jgi:hypothetical protein